MNKLFNIKYIAILTIVFACFFTTNKVKADGDIGSASGTDGLVLRDYYNCLTGAFQEYADNRGDSSYFSIANFSSQIELETDVASCTVYSAGAVSYYVAKTGKSSVTSLYTTISNCFDNNIGFDACFSDVIEAESKIATDVKNDVKEEVESVQEISGDIKEKVSDATGSGSSNVTVSTTTAEGGQGCDKIGSIGKYITGFYNIIRYLAPTLIIVFSVIEFLGVVFSGEDDKMEKAKKHFMIRIIAGVLILLIPFILEFILKTAGIIDDTLADAACNFLN